MRRPVHKSPTGRKASKSLAASILLHGALVTGLVGVSFYAGKHPTPKRVYNVNFGGASELAAADVAKESEEVLAEIEASADESAMDLSEGAWNEVEVTIRPEPVRTERLTVAPAESFSDNLLDPDFISRADFESPLAPEIEVPSVEAPQDTEPADVSPKTPETPEAKPYTPKRIEGKDADYPRMSLRLKEQGDVELRLSLDEEGRVRGVELLKSSGVTRLDEAAMSAAPKWRFDLTPPAGVAAEDVLRSFTHVVHFKLKQ